MKKYNILSLRILLAFMIIICTSFLPEQLPALFGDWICEGRIVIGHEGVYHFPVYSGCDYGDWNEHNPMVHWGFRHWILLLCSIVLFIVNICASINDFDSK